MATRGDIKNQIISYSHRTDLVGVVDGFIDLVTQRLNRRLGITLSPMPQANESNIISEHNPGIYLYGGLREMAVFTADNTALATYEQLYQEEVAQLNINYNGDEWDNDAPAMLSELEQAVEADNAA